VKLSVIVPAFNEERLLGGSLAAIREAMSALNDAELIVCDNNSTDRTAQIARSAGAKVVFEPVNQIARARNTGAAQASGDWLLFVDADSYPSKELFRETAEAIHGGHCLAGGATVTLESADPAIRFWVAAWNWLSRRLRWAAGYYHAPLGEVLATALPGLLRSGLLVHPLLQALHQDGLLQDLQLAVTLVQLTLPRMPGWPAARLPTGRPVRFRVLRRRRP